MGRMCSKMFQNEKWKCGLAHVARGRISHVIDYTTRNEIDKMNNDIDKKHWCDNFALSEVFLDQRALDS